MNFSSIKNQSEIIHDCYNLEAIETHNKKIERCVRALEMFKKIPVIGDKLNSDKYSRYDKLKLALMLLNEAEYLKRIPEQDMGPKTPEQVLLDTVELFEKLVSNGINFEVCQSVKDCIYLNMDSYTKTDLVRYELKPRPERTSSLFKNEFNTLNVILVPFTFNSNSLSRLINQDDIGYIEKVHVSNVKNFVTTCTFNDIW